MSIVLMAVLSIALVAAGAGVTFMLASALPQAVLQRAQDHGRYAGLAADDRGENTGKRMAAGGSNPRRHTVRVA
jgi:hypothetical protein